MSSEEKNQLEKQLSNMEQKLELDQPQASQTIDIENDRYPYSIVWTTLPCISCCCPCIGHTGIGDSEGIISDFAGSEYIGNDDFAFGKPYKYVSLNLNKINVQKYNQHIKMANQNYCTQQHNIVTNNCHSHVADALNNMEYRNKKDWTMVSVCCLTTFGSKFVNCNGFIRIYAPFTLLITVIVGIILMIMYL